MSWQHWDPPAIIIPAPPRAEIVAPTTQKEKISQEEHFRKVYDTPWNKLQPDGRINIDGQSSASVSPYSDHFRSQIEDGIWPLVELLYNKGYLPVSSCEGHASSIFHHIGNLFEHRSGPYVTIAVNREVEQTVINYLKDLSTQHVSITSKKSMANMDASHASIGKIKKATKKDIENEYLSLNWMFKRNYEKWSYVTIGINPWKYLSVLHVLRTQKEKHMILELAERYKHLPVYMQ